MYTKRVKARERYLIVRRMKESMLPGIIFGTIVGIIFGGSTAAFHHSTSETLRVFLMFGGVSALCFTIYGFAQVSFPKELYIKCRVQEGISDGRRDIILGDGTRIISVMNAIVADVDPTKGKEVEGYVQAIREVGKLYVYVEGNAFHSSPRRVFVNVPSSEIVEI